MVRSWGPLRVAFKRALAVKAWLIGTFMYLQSSLYTIFILNLLLQLVFMWSIRALSKLLWIVSNVNILIRSRINQIWPDLLLDVWIITLVGSCFRRLNNSIHSNLGNNIIVIIYRCVVWLWSCCLNTNFDWAFVDIRYLLCCLRPLFLIYLLLHIHGYRVTTDTNLLKERIYSFFPFDY